MTILGWAVWIGCSLFLCLFMFFAHGGWERNGIIISITFSTVLLFALFFYFNYTAMGKRAFKTQESNLLNGVNREVSIYDMNGELIKEYKGKFDVTYDDDRILFDDEKGLRHIIYYPTGTVIIDEIGE